MSAQSLVLNALTGLPECDPGCDLVRMALESTQRVGIVLQDDDVLVVAQKAVSKQEGRYVSLRDVQASPRALSLAATTNKDPRFVEVVLSESTAVVRAARNVLITRHRLGFVMANAGIDRSNLPDGSRGDRVLLLPLDPDAAAASIRRTLQERVGVSCGVIISDSFGRPWRQGVTNVALGVAGMPALRDLRGQRDRSGRVMETTQVAVADAVAAGAALMMGEGAEGVPMVHVRGVNISGQAGNGQTLLRAIEEDLFQ